VNDLIKKIAGELGKNHIPYMIIGGQAVLYYGEPRFTKDIDITLGISHDKLTDVLAIAENLKLKLLTENPNDFVKKTMVLPAIDEVSSLRVDFIFSFTEFERHAIGRSIEVKIDEVPVKFASLEDIIVLKIFAGRERDLEDVRNIILKNPHFDKKYVEKWLEIFSENNGDFLQILRNMTQ
jgi:predicted nucleotidyltransferase